MHGPKTLKTQGLRLLQSTHDRERPKAHDKGQPTMNQETTLLVEEEQMEISVISFQKRNMSCQARGRSATHGGSSSAVPILPEKIR